MNFIIVLAPYSVFGFFNMAQCSLMRSVRDRKVRIFSSYMLESDAIIHFFVAFRLQGKLEYLFLFDLRVTQRWVVLRSIKQSIIIFLCRRMIYFKQRYSSTLYLHYQKQQHQTLDKKIEKIMKNEPQTQKKMRECLRIFQGKLLNDQIEIIQIKQSVYVKFEFKVCSALFIIQVQMSAYCRSLTCKYNCCDIYGYCPTYSSSCYYYYDTTLTAGAIVGIVIGIVFFVIIFTIIFCWCRRMRQTVVVPPPVIVPPGRTQVYMVQPNNEPIYYNQQYPNNPNGGYQNNPYNGYNPNGGYQNSPYNGYNPNQPQNYQDVQYSNNNPQNPYPYLG